MCISSWITLALAKYIISFFLCLFVYICCCFGVFKNIERLKEEKYASMGDECVANLWSINVTLMDGVEDVYVAEINQYG